MQQARPVSAGDVALINSLIRHSLGQTLKLSSEELTLASFRLQREKVSTRAMRIELGANEPAITLWLRDDAVCGFFDEVCWPAFDQELTCLFVADMIAPALAWLSQLTDSPVRVRSVQAVNGIPVLGNLIQVGMQLTDKSILSAILQPSIKFNAVLLPYLATRTVRQGKTGLNLSAEILVGHQLLSTAEMNRIEIGSIILTGMPERRAVNANEANKNLSAVIAVGGRQLFNATIENSRLRVLSQVITMPATETGKRMNQNTSDPIEPPNESASLSLSFRLGAINMSLTDLQAIEPGYIFSTEFPTQEPAIDICVGLEVIGRGKLVQIGDQLGVEVSDWGNVNE